MLNKHIYALYFVHIIKLIVMSVFIVYNSYLVRVIGRIGNLLHFCFVLVKLPLNQEIMGSSKLYLIVITGLFCEALSQHPSDR